MKRYMLEITEDDRNNLLKIINDGQYQGAHVEYVVLLKNRILNAPENQEEIPEEKPKEK